MKRLPFEDVVALAHVIRSSIDCENHSIIFVLEFIFDQIKNDVCIPDVEHFFHEDVHYWHIFCVLDYFAQQSCFSESALDVSIALKKPRAKRKLHEILFVDYKHVKDEKYGVLRLETFTPLFVNHKFTIKYIP